MTLQVFAHLWIRLLDFCCRGNYSFIGLMWLSQAHWDNLLFPESTVPYNITLSQWSRPYSQSLDYKSHPSPSLCLPVLLPLLSMTNRRVVYTPQIWDKGMIHTPGRMELDFIGFYHPTQSSMQFKMYELFLSEIFHLISLDHSWLLVTEITESKTMDKGGDYCVQSVYTGEGGGTLGSHLRILHAMWRFCSSLSEFTCSEPSGPSPQSIRCSCLSLKRQALFQCQGHCARFSHSLENASPDKSWPSSPLLTPP